MTLPGWCLGRGPQRQSEQPLAHGLAMDRCSSVVASSGYDLAAASEQSYRPGAQMQTQAHAQERSWSPYRGCCPLTSQMACQPVQRRPRALEMPFAVWMHPLQRQTCSWVVLLSAFLVRLVGQSYPCQLEPCAAAMPPAVLNLASLALRRPRCMALLVRNQALSRKPPAEAARQDMQKEVQEEVP